MRRLAIGLICLLLLTAAACSDPKAEPARALLSRCQRHPHRCPSSTPSTTTTTTSTTTTTGSGSGPPPASGYFTATAPAGSWSSLPSDSSCASQVHRSTWEPRTDNASANHRVVPYASWQANYQARPRQPLGYNAKWDTWLLPRVDGNFTGTTDELMQWAACKWGIPDNVVRAVAYSESVWFQYEVYASGRCLPDYGCTDLFSSSSAASVTYCDAIAAFGHDYQLDFGAGKCPRTFGIVSDMSWQDPAWGRWPANQNGLFPFNRDSTAFSLDYWGAYIRGCYEGWSYLGTRTTGDLWGCIGSWYSGDWHDAAADDYANRAKQHVADKPWLTSYFFTQEPPCSTAYGCPRGWTG